MREIKFRAWDEIKAEMKFGLTIHTWGGDGSIKDVQPFEDGYELMQYTGLKDKNGVEIYEGDIVSLDNWSPKEMQICFIEGAFCLANKDGHFVGEIYYIHHPGVEQCKVIGNIYQNKELLK